MSMRVNKIHDFTSALSIKMRKGEEMKIRKGVKGPGSLKLKQDKKTTTERKIESNEPANYPPAAALRSTTSAFVSPPSSPVPNKCEERKKSVREVEFWAESSSPHLRRVESKSTVLLLGEGNAGFQL
jgi:hypothetical protein